MKRLALLALIACLVPVAATAGTISIQWFPGGNAHIATLYNDANEPIESFSTFCLEYVEMIDPGTNYPYTVDSIVKEATGSSLQQAGSSILTQGAVELFVAYASDLFPALTALDFQNAIWAVQGYSVGYNTTLLGSYVAKNGAYDPATGFGPALVYNPYDTAGPHQSFLRVPDGGATLMLLGGALMGLGALRRKFRG